MVQSSAFGRAAQGLARPWPLTRKVGIWGFVCVWGVHALASNLEAGHFRMHAFSPNTHTCLFISVSVSLLSKCSTGSATCVAECARAHYASKL